jgi:hypothetical protein
MNHLIQQQRLDIAWHGPENEALAFQHRLSDWASATLMPAVARVLDACLPAHTYLRVEKLEINIDDIKTANWEDILTQKIAEAIAVAISDKLHAAQQGTTSDSTLKTTPQRITEAFVYFLQTGLLPWHYPVNEARTWENDLRPLFSQSYFQQLILTVLKIPAARERLVAQFSEDFLAELLIPLQAQSATQVGVFFSTFEKHNTSITSALKKLIINNIWMEIWVKMSQKKEIEIRQILYKVARNST